MPGRPIVKNKTHFDSMNHPHSKPFDFTNNVGNGYANIEPVRPSSPKSSNCNVIRYNSDFLKSINPGRRVPMRSHRF